MLLSTRSQCPCTKPVDKSQRFTSTCRSVWHMVKVTVVYTKIAMLNLNLCLDLISRSDGFYLTV